MHLENSVKLDFKDVLIRPKRSTLTSRSEVDITREFKFLHSSEPYHGIPIIAANMDTTGTFEMASALARHKMSTALHKHYTAKEYVDFFQKLENKSDAFYSLGIGEHDWQKFREVKAGAREKARRGEACRSRRDPLCLHRRRQRLHGGVRRLREEGSRNLSRHRADGGQRRHGRHD